MVKGLPAQASRAIVKAMSDANEVMLKNGKKKRQTGKKTGKKK